MSSPTEFLTVLMELMDQLIDPHEKIPLANTKAAMFGITVPFHVSYQVPEPLVMSAFDADMVRC